MKTREDKSLTYQQFYFDLLADIVNSVEDVEQLFQFAIEQLKQFIDAPYGAIYVYHRRVQQFRLMHFQADNALFLPLEMVERNTHYDEAMVLQHVPLDHEVNIIPLKSIDGVEILFVLSVSQNRQPFTEEEKGIFVKETEKFLSIIIPLVNNKQDNLNHEFLYELSASLFAKNAQKEILTEIVDALNIRYPNYSFSLLLSQDSDAGCLPIKMIQYSDEQAESKSTLAFLTGELQIELQIEENVANIYAPLVGNQAIYGVLQIITPISTYLSRKSLEFLTEFANLAGIAIERITLYQNSKEQVSSLSFVNEFSRRLNSNLEIDEITKLVKNEIVNLCHASEVGFVYLNHENETEYNVLAESTAYFNTDAGSQFITFLMEKIKSDGELLFSGNFASNPDSPYHSVMAVPINHVEDTNGLAVILHEDKYFFTFENFKLIQALIQHTSLAITNTLLRERLERTIITDYLTGLYSRNYLEESIETSFKTDERGVLLLFDVDNFKQVNDNYGHHVGDEVIIQVADVMRQYVSIEDGHVPARWGGEELSIYLPNARIEEGMEIATIIRERVMATSKPNVTISCGVSTWEQGDQDTTINLFLRTDKALYRAKRLGKNRVEKN
ncbi:sensor domain-containing diguanylate cyclase [Oceanobacillus chungangensis]|uniref:GGDEF domain-containing protein n=1 Tax=Oceanobacillus chungangensis TaxID=1229152 RepID=A0A3D8PZB8_9BACI|nr:sensor domain-containing diguanylate cyclase [Oceanobacillus chungangensis]RDW21540.1 GGDEF domain-containing protein [Oceanobacillus chungangensis]